MDFDWTAEISWNLRLSHSGHFIELPSSHRPGLFCSIAQSFAENSDVVVHVALLVTYATFRLSSGSLPSVCSSSPQMVF